MAVLVIRAHKRFGVCRRVQLRCGKGGVAEGLLIELSLEGCRISNVASNGFVFEDCIEVEIEGRAAFAAQVRWHHDGMVGLRLTQPLHHGELAELLAFCRSNAGRLEQAKRA